jgi:hypothetical protein
VLPEDSAQSTSQKNPVLYQLSGRRDIPSGRPFVQSIIRPNDENFPSKPSTVSRSFKLLQLAFVRTFQQPVRTTLSVRQATRFLFKTQIWEVCCNHPNDVDSRSDALIHKASIAFKIQASGRQSSWSERASFRYGNGCIRSTVQTTIHLVQTHKASIWKLLAADVRSSGQQGNTFRMRLKSEKNFSEIFEISIVQLSVRTAYDYRPDGAQFYQARRSFEPSAYK